MGYGSYSHEAHETLTRARSLLPEQRVFAQTQCHPLMNPKGVRVRESRDSADHPNSLGIVFALDVTGSMGSIPRLLAREQLPTFMKVLEACKVPDPQLLFMAVGDATSDQAPLQVGQFESTAELMDRWLTWSYLEGGGGAWGQESYELALYFLAQHTELDCFVKRRKKGYVFLTGDEKPYPVLSKHTADALLGDRLDDDLKVEEIVALLQESFVPFFLIPDQPRRAGCEAEWRALLGDHVLAMSDPKDTCWVAASAVLISEGLVGSKRALAEVLEAAGAPKARLGATLRALEPLLGGLDAEPGLIERLFGG